MKPQPLSDGDRENLRVGSSLRATGARHDHGAMPAVIQVVSIDYDKAGREGAGAQRRSRLPTTWPVPDREGDVLHSVSMTEWSRFRPRAAMKDLGKKLTGSTV